jgi:basic amino acid/polyamine antiporter, APA family
MSQATSSATGFRPQLGLFDATMLVAGSMIGSGIFIVSVFIARDVGSAGWLMLVWLLTGAMTVAGALSFAELAAMMPHAGGTYVFLREAYGPLWGFLFGWTNFLVIQTGFIAAVGVAFAKFLGVLVPALGTDVDSDTTYFLVNISFQSPLEISLPVPWMDEALVFFKRDKFTITAGQLVAIGVAVVLTLLNCLGVREGKWVQNFFTVAKTAGLLLLIVVGLGLACNSAAITNNQHDLWGGITQTSQFASAFKIVPVTELAIALVLCGAMVGSLFSSDAWGNVTFAAAEVKEPRRNLPLSLFLGTGLVSLLYILANLGYLAALPIKADPALEDKVHDLEQRTAELVRAGKKKDAEALADEKKRVLEHATASERGITLAKDDRVGTAVMELVAPTFGVPLMAIAIMISTFGCVNGIILSNSRLCYAMARDGLFFRAVGQLSPRGVPVAGLILQLLWSIVLIFSGSYNELLDYVIFAALLFYVLTISALFVLRRKRPDWPRPYKAFGYPVVPAIYIALCAVIMVGLLIVKPIYSWPSFVIILTGIPVYFCWRGRNTTAPI